MAIATLFNGAMVGRVSTWSPFLKCGVVIVRMYDEKREIPRGKRMDMPEIPPLQT